MALPSYFVKMKRSELGREVQLSDHMGNSGPVRLMTSRHDVLWEIVLRLVKKYGLKENHTMKLTHIRGNKFKMEIFNAEMAHIPYSVTGTKESEPIDLCDSDNDDEVDVSAECDVGAAEVEGVVADESEPQALVLENFIEGGPSRHRNRYSFRKKVTSSMASGGQTLVSTHCLVIFLQSTVKDKTLCLTSINFVF